MSPDEFTEMRRQMKARARIPVTYRRRYSPHDSPGAPYANGNDCAMLLGKYRGGRWPLGDDRDFDDSRVHDC